MADGTWEPDFDEVVTTLDAQVAEHGGGAAVCVYHRGRPVIDAWTGAADTDGTPWRSDSIAVSYSTTKGVTCNAVDVTPLVVEYETAMLSDRHGVPSVSAAPVHASITGRPRWYTHTAAPPPCSATWASRVVTTSSKSGSHVPSAMAALPHGRFWHVLHT